MNSSNRWLIGIGGALVLLVVVALIAAVVARGRPTVTFAEDTPEGVTQRYLVALLEEDLEEAYSYLAPEFQARCTFEAWQRQSRFSHNDLEQSEIVLRDVDYPREGEAEVEVTISRFEEPGPSIFPPPVPVSPRNGYPQDFYLKRQADGSWRLIEPIYPVFGCPEPEKPFRPVAD